MRRGLIVPFLWVWLVGRLAAQPFVSQSGDLAVVGPDAFDSYNVYFNGADGQPLSVEFTRAVGDPVIYPIFADFIGLPTTLDASGAGSAVLISANTGDITLTGTKDIIINNMGYAQGAFGDSLGLAGIDVLGLSLGDGTGPNVTLTHTANLIVNGTGQAETAPSLEPFGTRTAQLSGLQAVSSGQQGANSTTFAGGDVTVTTTADSTITINQADSEVVTAGISASSAVGPGVANGTSDGAGTVTVTHQGSIQNTATKGAGIFATATGAQFTSSSPSLALGGSVVVELGIDSEIQLSDALTGIGVFAVSEAYTVQDSEKGDALQGGFVKISTDFNSSVVVGNSDSKLSIGLLAVSAGTDVLINPFSPQQTTGKSGAGHGGEVVVDHAGSVSSMGAGSIGIAALSIGGAAIVTSTESAGFLGSDGGAVPGNGDNVTVTTEAGSSVTTVGAGAHGIVALSVANGGIILNEFEATSESNSVIVGNSQSGGTGTLGGEVLLTHRGAITTGDGNGNGNASVGIVAQSIGGGGGSASGKRAAFVGDKGGAGGDGGLVNLTTTVGSTISTFDVNSVGVLAQSIGGGGGNGGNAEGLFVAVGGRGGPGGNGGDLILVHNGSIVSSADFSTGFIGQSVGGGGGHGGGATAVGLVIAEGIGGTAGVAGDGGTVGFTSGVGSIIQTEGNQSAGMIFQSIGGGGGTGGGSLSQSAGGSFSVAVSHGGSGGAGGDGDTVTVTNYSVITTGTASATNGAPNPNGADSAAIVLQSIGGGGGHGGSASAKAISIDPTDPPVTASATVALGGTGGAAGNADEVYLQNNGTLQTYGDGSGGVVAQSIGGGGGNGGDATAVSGIYSDSFAQIGISVAHGGKGGGGGDGGESLVENFASITTHGQNAAAILVQSIGGGGGNGGLGNANLNNPSMGSNKTYTLEIGLGGSNANGAGNGESAIVTNQANLTTYGSGAQGILAQSIGGGGGNAGGGQAAGSNNSFTANLSIGATGGEGGNSLASTGQIYAVEILNTAAITTYGGDATAILAQSIGGGGGNGGSSDINATIGAFSNLTGLALESSQSYGSNIAVGGTGGSGGAGGIVSLNLDANSILSTAGIRSYGVLAQSISGGGGTGGSADVTSNALYFSPFSESATFSADVAVGGKGGSGHDAGSVGVSQSGSITTSGYGSHGLFLQSVAGGGGVGADGTLDTKSTISLGIRIDGSNGASGKGGTVTATQTNTVSTTGDVAYGILAQSLGGGGGAAHTGGLPFIEYPSLGITWSGALHSQFTLGFDINNSDDADGGIVQVNHNAAGGGAVATLSTQGDWSHGIVAQSIGAGGGLGTSNTGSVSTARAPLDVLMGANSGKGWGNEAYVALAEPGNAASTIQTSGLGAYGIVAQSIGAGGGMVIDHSPQAMEYVDPSDGAKLLRLGASSSAKGGGNLAQLSGIGSVTTSGEAAHGVILQSIGGGGGILGSGTSSLFNEQPGITSPGVRLGGAAEDSSGGAVSINAGNTLSDQALVVIETSGENAFGLIAQSIGGGGGIATILDSNSSAFQMGSNSGNSNNGGVVTLNFNQGSSITTTGAGAHGIVAQSIGGGGGILNPNASSGLSVNESYGSQESKGYGGDVVLEGNVAVAVSGSGAVGILAQTIGGGGGLMNGVAGTFGGGNSSTNGSDNGETKITVNESVTASGSGGIGVFAQNVAGHGSSGNTIELTINSSVVGGSGATGNASGIYVHGGQSNKITVNNAGSVSSANQVAIRYYGEETLNVDNSGSVVGDVYLSKKSGVNTVGTFTNEAIGFFNPISRVEATVNDSGTTNLGTNTSGATVIFTGVYTQNLNAQLNMQIFGLGNFDSIQFENAHGIFEGSLFVNFSNAYIPQLGDTFTLVQGVSSNHFSSGFLDPLANIYVNDWASATAYVNAEKALILEITAVPEPGAMSLLVPILAPLLLHLRRRRLAGSSAGS